VDPNDAVAQAFEKADVVFLGTVKAAEPVVPGQSGILTFAVDRAWKGLEDGPVQMEFALKGTLCDVRFEPGELIVIYGFGPNKDGTFETSTCALATGVASRDEEISILNRMATAWASEPEGDWVAYGCGGGFAAVYPLSTIYRNGRRYSSTTSVLDPSASTTTELPPDPQRAAAVFAAVDKVDLAAVNQIQDPAPYGCYFKGATEHGSVNAIWGGSAAELPVELQEVIRLISATP
jgi:hypothetical protein